MLPHKHLNRMNSLYFCRRLNQVDCWKEPSGLLKERICTHAWVVFQVALVGNVCELNQLAW